MTEAPNGADAAGRTRAAREAPANAPLSSRFVVAAPG
jgi:hypothetical protein